MQSIVVTQTTTTVMATGVTNRRAKSLVNSKSNRNPLTASGWNERQPSHPVQTSAQGTFEVKLPGLKLKGKREDGHDIEAISLTDNGLRQIKSMIVKSSVRGHGRNKDKQGRLSSSIDERETKTSGQLTETSACSEDIGENRQPVCLATEPAEGESVGLKPDEGSFPKTEKEKRGPGRPPLKAEQNRSKKSIEKRNDPVNSLLFLLISS